MQFIMQASPNLPSAAQIADLEEKLQCTLHADYRSFLENFNAPDLLPLENSGASEWARPCILAKPSESYEPEWWDVIFNRLETDSSESYGLLHAYHNMDYFEHVPELLPFASTSGGVYFFLCVRGERAGCVFMAGERWGRVYDLWNERDQCGHDHPKPTLDDYALICESFTTFLEALRWIDYDKAGNIIVVPCK